MRKTSAGLLVLTVLAALSASVAVAELVGDFNGNNEVGLSDFAHFLDSFGTTTSSTNWDPALDFNSDGEIGLSDFVLPPRKATPIKRPGVVDKIVFSTLLGSYIPGMNEACSCCNYRSTEI